MASSKNLVLRTLCDFAIQIAQVIKITKFKHIFRALISPSNSLWAFKYHYRRVPERAFIEFLVRQYGCSSQDIQSAYNDLSNNSFVWNEVAKNLSLYPNGYGMQMTKESATLYLLVRLIKPERIIETGVSAGVSSTYILRALHDNNKGKLHSIDLPPDNLPSGKKCGWLVPEALRNRWHLHIGDAKDLLEPLLDSLQRIDFFIHDSLHTYEHMMWEFRTAWKFLRLQGLFLAHDVGRNKAFSDFMQEKGVPWRNYRVFHVLGGFHKLNENDLEVKN
jgi:predicted O-methyltransferase YrrM